MLARLDGGDENEFLDTGDGRVTGKILGATRTLRVWLRSVKTL
jgi:hypothetical protein